MSGEEYAVRKIKRISLFALFASFGAMTPVLAETASPTLQTVAQSHTDVWNAVAVDANGELYVSGPTWMGVTGPSVSKLDAAGKATPFPNARWNSRSGEISPAERFINVNAMRFGADGNLWIVDAGVTGFGGSVVPGGAKVVVINPRTNAIVRVYTLSEHIAKDGSYIDDIRLNQGHAYLTDAGNPGVVVLDLNTGAVRRVLDNSAAVRAPADRRIIVDEKILHAPNGQPLQVHADPLEVSGDGQWLYFASLEGPWYRIRTALLDDATRTNAEVEQGVEFWRDLPPVGGTVMDKQGNFYYSDLAENSVKRITVAGNVEVVVKDRRLHWVDAPAIDSKGFLYLPAAQVDRVGLFNGGVSKVEWPIRVYRINLK